MKAVLRLCLLALLPLGCGRLHYQGSDSALDASAMDTRVVDAGALDVGSDTSRDAALDTASPDADPRDAGADTTPSDAGFDADLRDAAPDGGAPPGHLIFVTSTTATGDFGGIAAADAVCQGLATGEGLSGVWLALLSDDFSDARTRLNIRGEVRDLSGGLIASSAADFWDGSILRTVNTDEARRALGNPFLAYTGTLSDGTRDFANCTNWTSTAGGAQIGFWNRVTMDWIALHPAGPGGRTGCNEPGRWYCVRV